MVNKNIYVIDKPSGFSSNQIIQLIKKNTNIKKIGHGGTLDPLATGVLVIGINNGTKELAKHLNETKRYLATIEFGYSTNTYDSEGAIQQTTNTIPTIDQINDFCSNLVNSDYLQEVPLYSAVKFKGQELYKYARSGQKVDDLPKKLVKLMEFKIITYSTKKLEIELEVSKGFYIRSFVNDLAKACSSLATMVGLRRLKSGDFSIEQALSVDEIIKKLTNKSL